MEAYYPIMAALINSVLVLLVVQRLKNGIPILKQSVPWLIPILAGAIGPAVAAGQNALFSWLGVPIDLSAIAAIFSGASAVAINQVGKQIQKSGSESAGPSKTSGRISLRCVLFLMLIMALALSMSCSTLQGKWKTATEDEKARLILADMQTGVDSALEFGEIYIATHPDKKPDWQARVLPLFKSVNDMIGENIRSAEANQGKVTVLSVLSAIRPKIAEIEVILIQWGFKK
jgi:hypothetical protein